MTWPASSSLAEAWPQKVATASLGAGLIQLAEYVAGLYGRLFEADPLLVLLCFTLLLVDAITGVAAAIKRGEKDDPAGHGGNRSRSTGGTDHRGKVPHRRGQS